MPEAVNSTSIAAPGRQHAPASNGLRQDIHEGFENVEHMFAAFNQMNSALLESGEKVESYGVFLIHQQILDKLASVVGQANDAIKYMFTRQEADPYRKDGANGPVWAELMGKIAAIVGDCMRESNPALVEDDLSSWPEPAQKDYFRFMTCYYEEIMDKLDGSRDGLDAGSLLPWLELKIRKEIVGVEQIRSPKGSADSLRNRLIAEMANEGIQAIDISQAMNIRKNAVERIIGRLTATDKMSRKAG